MSFCPKFSELKKLNDAQLRERYDALAVNTVVGTSFYREEIARRDRENDAREMRYLTKLITWMTFIVTVATVFNVVVVIFRTMP